VTVVDDALNFTPLLFAGEICRFVKPATPFTAGAVVVPLSCSPAPVVASRTITTVAPADVTVLPNLSWMTTDTPERGAPDTPLAGTAAKLSFATAPGTTVTV